MDNESHEMTSKNTKFEDVKLAASVSEGMRYMSADTPEQLWTDSSQTNTTQYLLLRWFIFRLEARGFREGLFFIYMTDA